MKFVRFAGPISINFTAAPTGVEFVSRCWAADLIYRPWSLWEYWEDDDDPHGISCSVKTMDNGGGNAQSTWRELWRIGRTAS